MNEQQILHHHESQADAAWGSMGMSSFLSYLGSPARSLISTSLNERSYGITCLQRLLIHKFHHALLGDLTIKRFPIMQPHSWLIMYPMERTADVWPVIQVAIVTWTEECIWVKRVALASQSLILQTLETARLVSESYVQRRQPFMADHSWIVCWATLSVITRMGFSTELTQFIVLMVIGHTKERDTWQRPYWRGDMASRNICADEDCKNSQF